MTETARQVRVNVPATSANLGPGFDTLGLALAYGDDLTVTVTSGTGASVQVTGEGEGVVPGDESNLVVQSIRHVFDAVGETMPGVKLEAVNRVPHGRGMGSSAAAIVSGVMAAKGLLAHRKDLDRTRLLELATELEGHPDNVAPALLGGLTIAWTRDGQPKAKKLIVHRGVSPLVLVPSFQVSTKLARSLQPESVPYADAVFNVSRSSLLIAALTQSPELLFEATEDRLHQNYRSAAMPATHALVHDLRDAGYAAVVSGAGPSILVLSNGSEERLDAVNLVTEIAPEWTKHALAVDTEGATVEEVHFDK